MIFGQTIFYLYILHAPKNSGASVYNLYDDEEEEGSAGNENLEENIRMKEKMRLLRTKMENLTVTKKVNNSKHILVLILPGGA